MSITPENVSLEQSFFNSMATQIQTAIRSRNGRLARQLFNRAVAETDSELTRQALSQLFGAQIRNI
jgi:hypothetical protein